MSKIWLVLKNEFIGTVTRRSFLLTLFLLPLTSFILLMIVSGIQKATGSDTTQMLRNLMMPPSQISMEGYIDNSGIVKTIPQDYENRLTPFLNEEMARAALADGKITAYYIIDKDFMQNGKVIYVRPDFNPLGGSMQSSSIDALLSYALTNGNLELAYRVQDPINVNLVSLSSDAPERDSSNPLTFALPYVVTFLFYIVILTSSTLLLNSITGEKQNRVLEILMTSITPKQMLTGKIIALGLVGLIQTLVWSGAGFLMLRFSTNRFSLGDAFKLPPSILLWGMLFFLLGYGVYASLMAGIGALVPNLREASQTTTMVIMPMVVPLMLISVLINAPNSPLSVFLSLFPLTAPVSMMTRLSATTVPIWQCLVAAGLLAGTTYFLIGAVAKLFRAQNLLSGASVSAASFLKALISK
jgi:ABC-2 type transport system permease protein